MEWLKLSPSQLSGCEVLAANFQKGKHGYKEKLIWYIYIQL